MTDLRKRGMDLADHIRELTEHHQHTEHYEIRQGLKWTGRDHITKVPPLMSQLWANDTPSAAVEDGARPGFASKPAARLDALDTAASIDLAVNAWILDLGEQPRHLHTIDALRQLHGLAPSSDPVTQRAIARDARRWWTQARVVTGWDSPAWNPESTCPQCGERGTLKIRLADRIGMCTFAGDVARGVQACRVTWDEATIGVLADHIRAESEAERTPRSSAGPCWCPWPEPVVTSLKFLCPGCGSARCWRAVSERFLDLMRGGRQVGA